MLDAEKITRKYLLFPEISTRESHFFLFSPGSNPEKSNFSIIYLSQYWLFYCDFFRIQIALTCSFLLALQSFALKKN